ncbi:MAG: hypothetical protein Q8O63_12970, partial [Hoeflea sp.]|nr:hypothetical protein [Hoeflea sp.]
PTPRAMASVLRAWMSAFLPIFRNFLRVLPAASPKSVPRRLIQPVCAVGPPPGNEIPLAV